MNFLEIIKKININVGKFASWALLFMVIFTCIIVVLRYVFSIGFIWMQELVRYLYATVFMLCAAYTLAEDAHVRVDIFYSIMKKKNKAIVNLLGSLFFLIPVCFSILYFSFNYVVNSWLQLEGSLEERGLHGVFLLKSLIWVFAIMLILQGIYIIFINSKIILNKR